MTYQCASKTSYDTGKCAAKYSFPTNVAFCPVTSPAAYPPLAQVPFSRFRAGYPDCSDLNGTCPITMPYTGNSATVAASLISTIIPTWAEVNAKVTSNAKLVPLLAAYGNGNSSYVTSPAFITAAVALLADPSSFPTQFGLLLGTAAPTASNFLTEPAFR